VIFPQCQNSGIFSAMRDYDDEGIFSVPIAQDAPEYDEDSTSHP